MSEREDRLPKWAQDKIRLLRMNLDDAEKTIRAMQFGSDNPRTNLHFHDRKTLNDWLPSVHRSARAYIGPTDRDWIEVRYNNEGKTTALHVHGDRTLLVRPRVTNVLEIFLENR